MAAPLPKSSSGNHPFRLFIGPLPAKQLPIMHDSEMLCNDDSFDAPYASAVRDVLQRNAYDLFLRQDGRAEDWNDDARDNLCHELMKRWEDCPWTRALRQKHHRGPAHWVGKTFEVGSILGVNVLDSHAPASAAVAEAETPREEPHPYASTTALSSTGPRSYWTARSYLSPPSPQSSQGSSAGSTTSLPEQHNGETSLFSSVSPLLTAPSAPALQTEYGEQGNDTPKSILKQAARSSVSMPRTKRRGIFLVDKDSKGKVPLRPRIREREMNDTPRRLPLEDDEADKGPASPTAVLSRTGNEVAGCSAGATADRTRDVSDGIFLRDRMLVRVCYTRSESLTSAFDEVLNRRTTHLRHEECMEFLVVWRKDMLELYEDYTIPVKEHFTGHKHLAFVIPLTSERTSVSLYSFVDLTFCVLCPPTPVRERYSRSALFFDFPKEGTNVFVFKLKSRSRARDWLWHLWLHLGGKIPTCIDIRFPDADLRIRMDVPPPEVFNLDQAYDTFSHKNIIRLIQRSLPSSHGSTGFSTPSWKTILERALREGKKLELAWRFGGQLDWVWQDQDVEGNARPWAVLSGLSLVQGTKPAHLELRIAEHDPDHVRAQTGNKVFEPPAIEGYLDRIKQQGRQRVYLTSHGGSLFSLLPSDANPPIPPSAHLSRLISGLKPSMEVYSQSLFESEVWRGTEQICTAHGMMDLRSIRSVRRAYQPLTHDDGEHVAQDALDARDRDEHHGHVQMDRAQMHLRRTFEIVLASGTVVRFEAHSAHDCIEWISRLRALVAYWSQRHHVDVRDEMDVAFAAGTRARLTPRMVKCTRRVGHTTLPEPPINSEPPVLMSLYNWCPLSSCRSVVKVGRVYTRVGVRGEYTLVQMFLVSGRLIMFNVSPTSALHHRNTYEISLLDAYVCSGYFAALALRRTEYNPESPNLPRRYDDGLETDEREEDTLFVIWYHNTSMSSVSREAGQPNAPAGGFRPTQPVPRLSRNSLRLRVFKAKSRVERDAWCWALGCEIEKVVRNNKNREQKVREAGRLVRLTK